MRKSDEKKVDKILDFLKIVFYENRRSITPRKGPRRGHPQENKVLRAVCPYADKCTEDEKRGYGLNGMYCSTRMNHVKCDRFYSHLKVEIMDL